MCGLAGFWGADPGRKDERIAAVRRMADTLEHRGPDDSGVWTDEDIGVALGFRRLSIIDLSSAGHQPMQSADGRFVIVFNGEVYNHQAIRTELGSLDIRFHGHSDTEVICNAFSRWGVRDTVRRCEGMFAIAAWDRTERTLTLARDRMGIKPMFVHWQPGFVSFGSELKSLMAGPKFCRRLSEEAVDDFLRYLYVPAPGSIFESTVKLEPGHIIEIRDPALRLPVSEPYWSLVDIFNGRRADRRHVREAAALDRLDATLTSAIRSHLEADVPVGAFLSGGIDSSAVVALATKSSITQVKTFSVAFDEREHNESEFAAEIARHLGTDHTEIRLSSAAALEMVPSLACVYDEPFADPSGIPALLVCRAAREHVAVALSGDGGDELFAGYNRYGYGAKVAKFLRSPRSLRNLVASALEYPRTATWDQAYSRIAPLLPAGLNERLVGEKIFKLAQVLRSTSSSALYDRLVSMWPPETPLLTRRRLQRRAQSLRHMSGPNLAGSDLIEGMLLADQLGSLADDQLTKVDRASMAMSLEVRVPLLDHNVVEESWSIPISLKYRRGVTKYLLRRLAYQHIPPALLERPKMGFSVPIASWLRGPLRPWAEDLFAQRIPELDEMLVRSVERDSWRRLQAGDDTRGLGIWAMLMLRQWARRWLS